MLVPPTVLDFRVFHSILLVIKYILVISLGPPTPDTESLSLESMSLWGLSLEIFPSMSR